MKIVIDHVRGSRRGQRQQFDQASRLSIGRHPDNDVSFDANRDLDASSRHAELRREGRGFVLYDVGSSNGTFVEGETVTQVKLDPGLPVVVEFGDGGPVLQIWVGKDSDEPAPPPVILSLRTPGEMWRAAIDAGRSAGGVMKGIQFARTLTLEVAYRSSWRFRLLLLSALASVVAALAAALL